MHHVAWTWRPSLVGLSGKISFEVIAGSIFAASSTEIGAPAGGGTGVGKLGRAGSGFGTAEPAGGAAVGAAGSWAAGAAAFLSLHATVVSVASRTTTNARPTIAT